jgi:uncharacterized cupredoxin-like copper-binding protein
MQRTATAITLVALLALAGAVAVFAGALSAGGGEEEVESAAVSPAETVEAPASPATEEEATETPAKQPEEPAREVTVRMGERSGEMFFEPDERRLKAGKVTVNARNVGDVEHDIVMVKTDLPAHEMPMTPEGGPDYNQAGHVMFGGHGEGGHGADGGDDIHVMPGETERIHANLEPGKYVLVCTYAGHYQAGQHASVRVVR